MEENECRRRREQQKRLKSVLVHLGLGKANRCTRQTYSFGVFSPESIKPLSGRISSQGSSLQSRRSAVIKHLTPELMSSRT